METSLNNNMVNSVELLTGQYRAKVLELFELGMTLKEMRLHFPDVRLRNSTFNDTIKSIVGHDVFRTRYSKLLSASQTGEHNTMYQRTGVNHSRYVSTSADGKGYTTVHKPRWWTGKSSDRVLLHHLVYCSFYGITQLPDNRVIHHIDCDKTNNSVSNLLLCTPSQHAMIHIQLRQSVTTIPQGSTFKRMEVPCPYCT